MKNLVRMRWFPVFLFALACAGINSLNAQPLNEIGVVLLHGKGGDTQWVHPLATSLRAAKVQVLAPNMPWHRARIYDKTFEESLQEINLHVEQLLQKGAKKVFVAGHSLGAVVAAGYGAAFDNISGVILLAPGHFVSARTFNANFKEDLARAEQLISAGKGDVKANFGDINMGKAYSRRVTARIFNSWFSPDGPADFVANMTRLKKGIAVLYVASEQDPPVTKNRGYAFDRAPESKGNLFTIIPSDHLAVPADSAAVVLDWLRQR